MILYLAIRIYNRWGTLVFTPLDRAIGWNGIYEDVEEPIGAYAFMISYSFGGQVRFLNGNVTLVR